MDKSAHTDRFSLKSKTAIVTGGNGILGKKFCAELAEKGANIVIADLDEQLTQIHSEELIREYGIGSIGIKCDVSNPESVKRMVNHAVEKFGNIHILI